MTLALPLLGLYLLAAVVPLLVRRLGRDTGYVVAAGMALALVPLIAAAPDALGTDPPTAAWPWLPSLGVSFALRLDALGLLFAVVVLGIGTAVLTYTARYQAPDDPSTGRLLTLLTIFGASMLGLVLADDVIALFLFWELTTVTSFFLIGGKGEGGDAARRALLVTALGGLALLAALVLVSQAAATTSLSTLLADPTAVLASPLAPAMAVLVILGAATKSAQLPFQFWLPGAMVAPTPVSTYLHAATMVKAGSYVLLRFTGVFASLPVWRASLLVLGLATAVFGATVALTKHDLKALLAASTISQLGVLTALVGLATPLALAAAALHTLGHAIAKAALFMSVGVIDHTLGSRDLRQVGGIARALPMTSVAVGLGAASMAGLPPLVGFVAKEEAIAAMLAGPGTAMLAGRATATAATVVLAVASVGTLAYSARMVLGLLPGPQPTLAHPPTPGFELPALILGALALLLGPAAGLLGGLANGVALATTGVDPGLEPALWHGLTTPLAVTGAMIAVGAGLVAARHRVASVQSRVRLADGAAVFDAVYRATLALGHRVGAPATSLSPAAFLLPVLAVTVLAGTAAALVAGRPPGAAPVSQPPDWALVALLAVCVLATAQARSRLAAVTALGLSGFLVAGWFVLLGAPDLALTQLLVETLTVTVVVVVFRRLPGSFAAGGQRRTTGAAVIAVGVGVLAGTATYLLTGRREPSELSERFIAEGAGVTGGSNVVNTILVDLRAFDTLGEVVVLAVATLGIYALTRLVRHDPLPRPAPTLPEAVLGPAGEDTDDLNPAGATGDPDARLVRAQLWQGPGTIDSVVLQTLANSVGTFMVVVSLWLLVRGHDAVGGGFIGGLTAGAAVVLFYLSHGHERVWQSRWLRIAPLIGTGVLIAVGYGLLGLVFGEGFLAGGKLRLPGGVEVAASLVFDVGVYLVVVAMVVAIVRHLGQGLPEDEADPTRAGPRRPTSRQPAPGRPTSRQAAP